MAVPQHGVAIFRVFCFDVNRIITKNRKIEIDMLYSKKTEYLMESIRSVSCPRKS